MKGIFANNEDITAPHSVSESIRQFAIGLVLLAPTLYAQTITPPPATGSGSGGAAPMYISYNTASSTCSVTSGGGASAACTSAPTGYGSGGAYPGITISHNYGLALPLLPWVVCAQTSTDSILGGQLAAASPVDVVGISNNQIKVPLSAGVTGACSISTGGVGPSGSNGTNGTNGSTGATGPAGAGATFTIGNASSTGTTVNTLTKLTGAPSTAVLSATTDTGHAVGITISGAGTSGTATVQNMGYVQCVFDGATTAGDYVQISSTTAGNCHDTGATSFYPTAGQVLGLVLSTNRSGSTY